MELELIEAEGQDEGSEADRNKDGMMTGASVTGATAGSSRLILNLRTKARDVRSRA